MHKGIALAAVSIVGAIAGFSGEVSAAPTWTQVYTQTTTSGVNTTHSLRGLALSSDGSSIYGGYIKGDAASANTNGAAFARYDLTGSPPVGTAPGVNPLHHVNAVDPTTLRQ